MALGVVDLPPSIREELHDGVDGSTPPSRQWFRTTTPETCRGGFAGGRASRRSAAILSGARRQEQGNREVERDVRGSAGCAWAEPFAKLVKWIDFTTLFRGLGSSRRVRGHTRIEVARVTTLRTKSRSAR